jgi:hypothetical protein
MRRAGATAGVSARATNGAATHGGGQNVAPTPNSGGVTCESGVTTSGAGAMTPIAKPRPAARGRARCSVGGRTCEARGRSQVPIMSAVQWLVAPQSVDATRGAGVAGMQSTISGVHRAASSAARMTAASSGVDIAVVTSDAGPPSSGSDIAAGCGETTQTSAANSGANIADIVRPPRPRANDLS